MSRAEQVLRKRLDEKRDSISNVVWVICGEE